MNVVSVYKSKEYLKDEDFKDEDEKDLYYESDFWNDCDYLVLPSNNDKKEDDRYDFVILGDEVIVRDDCIPLEIENILIKLQRKIIRTTSKS